MKKYRLIKYDVTGRRIEHGTECFSTLEEAAKQMLGHSEITYRIEEFEESITDRVKSYEDACEVLGVLPIRDTVGDSVCVANNGLLVLGADYSKHIIALLKLETITAALNEGWKPDWGGSKQKKYSPLFAIRNGEFKYCGFINQAYETSLVTSSRLVCKSSNLAEYAAKQFKELYEQLLVEKF